MNEKFIFVLFRNALHFRQCNHLVCGTVVRIARGVPLDAAGEVQRKATARSAGARGWPADRRVKMHSRPLARRFLRPLRYAKDEPCVQRGGEAVLLCNHQHPGVRNQRTQFFIQGAVDPNRQRRFRSKVWKARNTAVRRGRRQASGRRFLGRGLYVP